jgi:hypothetical protein
MSKAYPELLLQNAEHLRFYGATLTRSSLPRIFTDTGVAVELRA